ncbi:hypothetical protein [Streptomyces sp. NPDC002054]|uniref:hypothetical protein n=1 Tax=Streptomyces sp. NPDC002054 TaxID=3154663 RepID=UPI00332A2C64
MNDKIPARLAEDPDGGLYRRTAQWLGGNPHRGRRQGPPAGRPDLPDHQGVAGLRPKSLRIREVDTDGRYEQTLREFAGPRP